MSEDAQACTIAQQLFGSHFSSINTYVDILIDRGISWGLLGPREADRIWERHILNSVSLTELIPAGSRVADIGSGAGLPGVPLAILRPDLHVTCVEPLLRRSRFLEQTVDELGLRRQVTVVRARADEVHQSFDVVTGRALAPLDRLAGWCSPLLGPGGRILALKGESAAAELDRDRSALDDLGLDAVVRTARAHPDLSAANVVEMRRRDQSMSVS